MSVQWCAPFHTHTKVNINTLCENNSVMADKPRKKFLPRESRLVAEWLERTHPNALQWKRVRLGPIAPGKDPKYYGILRRYCDIIVKVGTSIMLIEAKMRPNPTAVGQLLLYRDLFPQTPEFTEYHELPIHLVFLTTVEDPVVKAMCGELDISYAVYGPPWAMEYLEELAAKKPGGGMIYV